MNGAGSERWVVREATVGVARPPNTALRFACVGDVHDLWSAADERLLRQVVRPDVVLFVGDYGNENVGLVRSVAASAARMTAVGDANTSSAHRVRTVAAILGNHDAWYTATARGRRASPYDHDMEDRVREQLQALRHIDVGYGARRVPLTSMPDAASLSIVGGRPFSWGGPFWKPFDFYQQYYRVRDMRHSAERIVRAAECAMRQEAMRMDGGTGGSRAASSAPLPSDTHNLVFLAHNGPYGLGDRASSICGRDFVTPYDSGEPSGDFGCPDLQQAIAQLKQPSSRAGPHAAATARVHVPLCVFGHMHEALFHGASNVQRTMVTERDGTVYVNTAVVPRIRDASNTTDIRRVLGLSPSAIPHTVLTRAAWHQFTVIDTCWPASHAADEDGERHPVVSRPGQLHVQRVMQCWLSDHRPDTTSLTRVLYQAPAPMRRPATHGVAE